MKLVLYRKYRLATYTIGKLYINGVYFCDTIEDRDRGLTDQMPEVEIISKKIYGQTAIPLGTYHVAMDIVSPRLKSRYYAQPYGGKLPCLLNVKGYDGILIHPFNTAEESLGCIAPGENKVKGKVINSAATFYKLMDQHLLPAYRRHEEITIDIRY